MSVEKESVMILVSNAKEDVEVTALFEKLGYEPRFLVGHECPKWLVVDDKGFFTDYEGSKSEWIFLPPKEYSVEELRDKVESFVNDSTVDINTDKPVKSDGGSSAYYFSKLPEKVINRIVESGGIEIKDIVRYCFGNDADTKDIIKALKRIHEWKKGGGKEGCSPEYDLNKCHFYLNEIQEDIKIQHK